MSHGSCVKRTQQHTHSIPQHTPTHRARAPTDARPHPHTRTPSTCSPIVARAPWSRRASTNAPFPNQTPAPARTSARTLPQCLQPSRPPRRRPRCPHRPPRPPRPVSAATHPDGSPVGQLPHDVDEGDNDNQYRRVDETFRDVLRVSRHPTRRGFAKEVFQARRGRLEDADEEQAAEENSHMGELGRAWAAITSLGELGRDYVALILFF